MQNEPITQTYFYFIDQLVLQGLGGGGLFLGVSEMHAGFLS